MANLRTNNLCGEGGRNAYNGSVFFNDIDGANGYDALTVPAGSDFAYGTGDFTFEAYVWVSTLNDRIIFNQAVSGNNYIVFYITSSGQAAVVLGHSNTVTSTATIAVNSWNHVAVSRASGSVKVFVNGIGTSGSSITTDLNDTTRIPTIGKYTHSTQLAYKGYISNLRICKGHAVYTSDFTPPTSPLKVHYISENDKTVLLCCQDSDDPTQEATGKTITAYGGVDFSHNPDNLIKNGNFDVSATADWTLTGGTAALGTGQSGTFNDGNHLVLTASSSYAYLKQSFTTVIGRTYRVNAQSNGGDASYISTSTSESDAVITDIRSTTQTTDGRAAEKNFIATQTTYYVILRGTTGGANFDTVSVYEQKNSTPPKVIPPVGVDAGNTFDGAISMNSLSWMYFPTGRTEERGRGRGVLFGGYNPSSGPAGVDEIYYLHIQSMGNAIRFGDLSTNSYSGSTTCASSTRALKAGGAIGPGSSNPNKTNNIEFVTIATTGNTQDFGDMLDAISFNPGGGNQTRGIWMGGASPGAPGSSAVNPIQYVTIANLGNSTDFGDLRAASYAPAVGASPTRILAMGGGNASSFFAYIDYVEIATTGNAQDFGDMSTNRNQNTGVSSNTRAIAMGGNSPSGLVNVMEFVTIATLGDASDFGDLSSGTEHTGSVNNSIRGVQTGGRFPSYVNTLESITIATTGNSSDFGDIQKDSLAYIAGASDSHGGLS